MIELAALPRGVVVGDPVTVSVRITPTANGAQCFASPHDEGTSQEVNLHSRPGGMMEGKFTPDCPGRWWVAIRHDGSTTEACFWVSPRRVRF